MLMYSLLFFGIEKVSIWFYFGVMIPDARHAGCKIYHVECKHTKKMLKNSTKTSRGDRQRSAACRDQLTNMQVLLTFDYSLWSLIFFCKRRKYFQKGNQMCFFQEKHFKCSIFDQNEITCRIFFFFWENITNLQNMCQKTFLLSFNRIAAFNIESKS